MTTAIDFSKAQWRQVAGKTTEELQVELMLQEARDSFWAFRKYLRPKWKRGWWQRAYAAVLQRFWESLVRGERPKLLIEAPRQHGKTMMIVDFLAWACGKNPDLRSYYASYSSKLGKRANKDLQRIFSSARYLAVFPGTRIQLTKIRDPSHPTNSQKTQTVIEFVGREGSFSNTTVLGAVNGESIALGVIDDPMKDAKESRSIVKRETAWQWMTTDFFGCMTIDAGLLIIGARRHKDDPIGRLTAKYREAGKPLKKFSYPAIAVKDERYRKEGEALSPEIHDLEQLRELKLPMNEHDWQATYQQNPIDEGGNIILGEWLLRYQLAPLLKYRVIYGDTAQKAKESNDYSVFQCWGYGTDGKIYLLDMIRGKWLSGALRVNARAFWTKHAAVDVKKFGKLRAMKIEDKASGTGLIQELKEPSQAERKEGAIPLPVIAIERTIDRYTRCLDVLAYIQNGYVMLPASAPYTMDVVSEAEAFTSDDTHAHDDTLDPLFDAVEDMLGKQSKLDRLRRGL